jgi:hypothetical protein
MAVFSGDAARWHARPSTQATTPGSTNTTTHRRLYQAILALIGLTVAILQYLSPLHLTGRQPFRVATPVLVAVTAYLTVLECDSQDRGSHVDATMMEGATAVARYDNIDARDLIERSRTHAYPLQVLTQIGKEEFTRSTTTLMYVTTGRGQLKLYSRIEGTFSDNTKLASRSQLIILDQDARIAELPNR